MIRVRVFSLQCPTVVWAITFILTAVSLHAQAVSPAAKRMRNLNDQIISNSIGAAHTDAADVISQRAAALSELIEHDPAQALELALSPELLADLATKFPGSAARSNHTEGSGERLRSGRLTIRI